MSPIENPVPDSLQDDSASTARAQHVRVVAWLVGITAFVAFGSLTHAPTIGMGFGVIGVSGMVTLVSYFILRGT